MADRVSTIFAPTSQKYYKGTSDRSEKTKIRKVLASGLVILGLGLSSYFGYILVTRSKFGPSKPHLFADVYYGKAKIFVDGAEIGETPVENLQINKGSRKVKLESDGAIYETSVTFTSGTSVLIKRDLGVDQLFSGGLDVWLEKSSGNNILSVISEPSDVQVFIDGTDTGKTPFSTDKLVEGAYEVRLEKTGYEPISERINIVKGEKVNASFKLFPLPVPGSVKLMEGSSNLYDMSSDNSYVVTNPGNWAKALIYWNKTRGVNIMGYGINRELVFNYILDFNGVFYDTDGQVLTPDKVALADGKIAYLRRESDGVGISPSAKESLAKIGTTISGAKSAKVKDTPTGWLRVRSQASLNGDEIGKLNTGDSVTILEKKTGWYKIKSGSGLEGWASSDYLELL